MLELEVENDDLRRQLAERADTLAASASLDLLYPERFAELDRLVASGKLERVLEWTEKCLQNAQVQRVAS